MCTTMSQQHCMYIDLCMHGPRMPTMITTCTVHFIKAFISDHDIGMIVHIHMYINYIIILSHWLIHTESM